VAVADRFKASFPTALHFKSSTEFSDHLAKKAKEIKGKVNEIFTNLSDSAPIDVEELRKSLTKLLASQKELEVKFDRIRLEKEELSERLESASLRYLKAEKRLDRAKSAAVAKLEQQSYAGTGNSAGSGIGAVENGVDERVNGALEDEGKIEAAQLAHKEAAAIVEKQKSQLDTLVAENKTLTEQLTSANTRLTNLSDDDYARTELFKNFKTQHEEVIKRINHLEATNIQLREEAEKLQAERSAYRTQIKDEADTLTGEIEGQLERVDADLTRIRSARDELLADLSMRKASQEQERVAIHQMKELVGAKDDRITSLELEVQRLRAQLEEQSDEPTPRSEVEDPALGELQRKYVALEQSFASVNNELPAMEKAYKRSMALSSKKVMDFVALEEKVTMLIAEKSKADQKYFAARKDMDLRIGEVRALRAQNAKSSEIITQLKEVEASNRALLAGLEKQLSDLRLANNTVTADNRRLEGSSAEALSRSESLKNHINELTNLLKSKDTAYSAVKQQTLSLEAEIEQLRTKYEHSQKEKATWKAKSTSNISKDEENLMVNLIKNSQLKNRANKIPADFFLQCLQGENEGHCTQNLWSRILHGVC
jgi:E3 ubiquitin-protein ligase BRE1